MAAYVIADVEVTHAAGFEEYRKLVPATIERYGGRFVVRGGQVDALEGAWRPKRLVILEFPSVAEARRWYDSEEYRKPKAMRLETAKTNLLLVEGL